MSVTEIVNCDVDCCVVHVIFIALLDRCCSMSKMSAL